jgi:DDE superfamily endonuclease
MRLGRPNVALILTEDERVRLDSLAHRSRTAPHLARRARIMDNYGTHKTPLIRHWFAKRPRFQVHFTPTDGSWLNLVERWFAELTNKQLRRGIHRSVAQLKAAIREFIDAHHADPKPFVWTKTADQILESIARFAQRTLDFQAAPVLARTTRTGH